MTSTKRLYLAPDAPIPYKNDHYFVMDKVGSDSAVKVLVRDFIDDNVVLSGGNVATKANGVSAAGQKVLTVDSTTGFIVGAYITYLLNGATLEGNTIASIQAGVSLTLGTNIGTGGVLDDSYISMISISEYLAAQAIPHADTLMLPQTMEYANGGIYNVKAYGAIGDGTTDDTIAIQAAVDDMPVGVGAYSGTQKAAILDFPPGKYKITAPITFQSGTIIQGAGQDASVIFNATTTLDSFQADPTAAESASRVVIRNLAIWGSLAATAGNAITLDDGAGGTTRNCSIQNVDIRGHFNGVMLSNALSCTLSHVRISSAANDGFASDAVNGCYSVSFDSCYALSCGRHGYNLKIDFCVLSNCASDSHGGNGYNFVSSRHSTIISCDCEYCDGDSVYFDRSDYITLISCTFVTPALSGIELDSCQNMLILNCHVGDNIIATSEYSLKIVETYSECQVTQIGGYLGLYVLGTSNLMTRVIRIGVLGWTLAPLIGIGTDSPDAPMHLAVDGAWPASTDVNSHLIISGRTNLNERIGIGYDTTTGYGWIQSAEGGVDYKNLILNPGGARVGISALAPSGKLHIDQDYDAAAIPALKLNQTDISEGFVDYTGTSAASAAGPISSWTTGAAIQGFVRVEINGAAYWMPYYSAPTS